VFCTKCGTELPDDSQFCRTCGQSLGVTSASRTDAAAVSLSEKSTPPTQKAPGPPTADPRGRGWSPLIGADPNPHVDAGPPSPSTAVRRNAASVPAIELKAPAGSGKRSTLVGEVREFRANDEGGWTFRLHGFDDAGNPLPPVEVERWRAQSGALLDGDRVEVEVGRGWRPGEVLNAKRIHNVTTGMMVERAHRLWFGKKSKFIGEVRGFQATPEGQQKTNVSGGKSITVAWTFRLQRFDDVGNRLPVLLVEMCGLKLVGGISEGDRVEVEGKWKERKVFRAKRIHNLSTGMIVKKAYPAPKLLVTIMVCMFPFLVLAMIFGIFFPPAFIALAGLAALWFLLGLSAIIIAIVTQVIKR
jgi:hypothetical protein